MTAINPSPGAAALVAAPRERSAFRVAAHKLVRRPGFVLSVVVMIGVSVIAIAGARVAPYQPNDQSAVPFLRPSADHWFGTDGFGRDVFSRVLVGAREVMLVAPGATILAVVAGTVLGLISGYSRGWVDEGIMRTFDAYGMLPNIMVVVLIVGLVGRSTFLLVVLIGISYTPIIARQVRARALQEREKQYVEAARLRGESAYYIMFREILPNCVPVILVEGTMRLGYAVFTAASLSFLGLGAASGSPEWGALISENRQNLQFAWWTVVFPSIAIILFVVAVTLIADNFREVTEP